LIINTLKEKGRGEEGGREGRIGLKIRWKIREVLKMEPKAEQPEANMIRG
jgi:hypothetical protein